MKKIAFVLIAASLCLASCKKKDKESAAEEPTTAPTPVPGTRGLFESAKFVIGTSNSITVAGSLNKGFLCSKDLILNAPTGALLNIGNVAMNFVTFKKDLYQLNRYDDTTSTTSFSVPQVWTCAGSGEMGAFTYSNNSAYPNYTGYTAIPDSFQISGGITFPLNSYSGVDEIVVNIVKQSNTMRHTQSQFLGNNVSSIQIAAADIATVDTCKDASINIIFYKNNVQEVSGKKCNFRTAFYYQKNGVKFK